MPTAYCLFRSSLHYRRDAFSAGLERNGYTVEHRVRPPRRGDLLLIWNRLGAEHQAAKVFEAAGATVVVAENGYLGPPGGDKRFALALGHHNGAGTWRSGGPERWTALDVPLQPWRTNGHQVVVLLQRGIGAPGVAQPASWARPVVDQLRAATRRPVVLRQHPGLSPARLVDKEPHVALANAWCVVTWGSGAALKALVAGVPVFHGLGQWIGAAAARPWGPLAQLETPLRGDRLPMLRRLAWAQWTLAEIKSGEAFRWLLSKS